MNAVNFLERFRPDGPWLLSAIGPDGKIITKLCENTADADCFVNKYNGKYGLYYHVNPTDPKVTNSKASREEIISVDWLHVDVDPKNGEDLEAERERILTLLKDNRPKGVPTPTIIVDSGGGYQALWKLTNPIKLDGSLDQAENASLWNVTLERRFNADTCHNIDRLLRLPGTINIPNETKRKKGRVERPATVVFFDESAVYDLSDFEKAQQDTVTTTRSKALKAIDMSPIKAQHITDLSELDKWRVLDRYKALIEFGDLRDKEGPKQKDDSNSAWLFDALCGLARCDVPEDAMYGLITNHKWLISQSVLNKGCQANRYATRQVRKAIEVAREAKVARDDKGLLIQTRTNFKNMLRVAGITVRHNEFRDTMEFDGVPGFPAAAQSGNRLISRIALIGENYGFTLPKEKREDAIHDLATDNSYHPVRDYFDGLEWDGTPRARNLFTEYFVARSPFAGDPKPALNDADVFEVYREWGEIFMMAAVKRIFEPGCKYDLMLLLIGDQGVFKSTAFRKLCPNEDWFSDDFDLNWDGKQTVENTGGKMIVEVAEMNGNTRADISKIKAAITRQVEVTRKAYGKDANDYKRQFIMVATDNDQTPLRDTTGNRRFAVVFIDSVNLDAIERDRDQLWAEAKHKVLTLIKPIYVTDPNIEKAAAVIQSAAKREAEFTDVLHETFADFKHGCIRVADAQMIGGDLPRTPNKKQLEQAMHELGFKKKKMRVHDSPPNTDMDCSGNLVQKPGLRKSGTPWCFVRGNGLEQIDIVHAHDVPIKWRLVMTPRVKEAQQQDMFQEKGNVMPISVQKRNVENPVLSGV